MTKTVTCKSIKIGGVYGSDRLTASIDGDEVRLTTARGHTCGPSLWNRKELINVLELIVEELQGGNDGDHD